MRTTITLLLTISLLQQALPCLSASRQTIDYAPTDSAAFDSTATPFSHMALVDVCPGRWCGDGDHPCCCDTRKPPPPWPGHRCCPFGACQLRALNKKGTPIFAFLGRFGSGPGVPCCGLNCTSSQCLQLLLVELQGLEKPLDIQQSRYKPVPDEERCCGEKCTDAQCFQNFDYAFVELQNPIVLSLKNSTKSGKGEDVDEGNGESKLKVEI